MYDTGVGGGGCIKMGKKFYRIKTESWAQDVGCADIITKISDRHFAPLSLWTDCKQIAREGRLTVTRRGAAPVALKHHTKCMWKSLLFTKPNNASLPQRLSYNNNVLSWYFMETSLNNYNLCNFDLIWFNISYKILS